MAFLPVLPNSSRVQQATQINFQGLHAGENCRDGQWKDMKNMSVRDLPVIRTRERRYQAPWAATDAAAGYVTDDGRMIYIDGYGAIWQQMLEGGERMRLAADGTVKSFAGLKIVRFGNRAMIMPDGMLLKIGYRIIGRKNSTEELPKSGEEGDAWIVGSLLMDDLVWVRIQQKWVNKGVIAERVESQVTTGVAVIGNGELYGEQAEANSLRVVYADFASKFREGDAVTISGCTTVKANNQTLIIREIENDTLRFSENAFTIPEGMTEYTEAPLDGEIKIERKWPELDFVFEHGNRMWGGKDKTIYCSKLGDPLNWFVLGDGLSTDGWQLETQSDGKLTGGISYAGYPTFFKPTSRIMVYGSNAANFSTRELAMTGAAAGNGMTQVTGGRLVYRAEGTMMIYASEGYPEAQSDEVGKTNTDQYDLAATNGREYIGLIDADGAVKIMCWDARRNAWAIEDAWDHDADHDIVDIMATGEDVYLLRLDGVVEKIRGDAIIGWTMEDVGESLLETGDMTGNAANRKWVTRVLIRAVLEPGATLEVEICHDGGEWLKVGSMANDGKRIQKSWYLPVRPNRCDNFRIRFRGEGEWQLRSMAVERRIGTAMR